MKELKNMLIVDVTECSDHAKTRIGRVIELIAMQEPDTAIMWYPEWCDCEKEIIFKDRDFTDGDRNLHTSSCNQG